MKTIKSSNRVKSEKNDSDNDDSHHNASLPPQNKRPHKGSDNKRSDELGVLY